MTPTHDLLEELRLLRSMGERGRQRAAHALKSARLGRQTEHPGPSATGAAAPTSIEADDALKFLIHELDAGIVHRGGKSIFVAKPVGELSAEAEQRLEAWAFETPRVHPDAGGPKTGKEGVFQGPRYKPGRIVAGLMGKLGGFASDREDER